MDLHEIRWKFLPQASRSFLNLPKPSKTRGKPIFFKDEIFRDTDLFVFMDWTISDGSGGESYTVGRAESESEVEIVGKPGKIMKKQSFEILNI